MIRGEGIQRCTSTTTHSIWSEMQRKLIILPEHAKFSVNNTGQNAVLALIKHRLLAIGLKKIGEIYWLGDCPCISVFISAQGKIVGGDYILQNRRCL
jgi:hypothetical protein